MPDPGGETGAPLGERAPARLEHQSIIRVWGGSRAWAGGVPAVVHCQEVATRCMEFRPKPVLLTCARVYPQTAVFYFSMNELPA